MEASNFKNLLKSKPAQIIKEEYMLGKHSKLTDRQLRIVCEKAGTGRGGCFFKYKPTKEQLERKEQIMERRKKI